MEAKLTRITWSIVRLGVEGKSARQGYKPALDSLEKYQGGKLTGRGKLGDC